MNHSPAHTPKLGATIHYLPSFRNGTVSIHAPTWGATRHAVYARRVCAVSIHAPTWGATGLPQLMLCCYTCFNPRSHVGSDDRMVNHSGSHSVSIHAPTWGATRRIRPAEIQKLMFQSTLPRGERPKNDKNRYNPCLVSIHAPAWGATA